MLAQQSQAEAQEPDFLRLTAQIVAAHVSRNPVQPEGIATLITQVYDCLRRTGQAEPPPAPRPDPAVPVKKSVFPDYIVCLEDGKKLKTLKRHLMAAYGMTGDQYRQRWGLPSDYPLVAPLYAERRSEIARRRRPEKPDSEAPPAGSGAGRGRGRQNAEG